MTTMETTTAPATEKSPLATVAKGLEARREQFRAMLPSHIKAEHFERVVMTAINMDPELLTADRRSLYNACARAASDGLLPDKREGALVLFKDRDNAKLVAWMPMVFGLIKKIRQSGEVDSVGARIVYQNEIDQQRFRFIIEDGAEKLYHDPMLWGDRGAKVLVYAYARFKNGFIQYQPVHRDDIAKRRKTARTDKIWAAWEDEMWLKTAIRMLASKMPLSAEIMSAGMRDEDAAPTEFDKMRNTAMAALAAPVEEAVATEVLDEPLPEPEPEAPQQKQESKTEVKRMPLTAETYIRNCTASLDDPDFTTVEELEEFAIRVRDNLASMKPSASEHRRLLAIFNAAVTERVNAVAPQTPEERE